MSFILFAGLLETAEKNCVGRSQRSMFKVKHLALNASRNVLFCNNDDSSENDLLTCELLDGTL